MSTHGTYNPNRQSGNRYPKKNYFKLKEGSNLFRVLPPFKTLAQTGDIAKYWALYWLTDSEGRKKPVPTIQRKSKEGKIIQHDPIADRLSAMKSMIDAAAQAGENPEVVKQMTERLDSFNLDKSYYLNVMNPAGEIGVLPIRYTAFNNFMEKLKKLSKEGVDAINAGENNGVFFDFQKLKDERGRTIYPVDVATRTSRDPMNNGRIQVEYMMAPIDEKVLARMENEAFDLANMYQIRSVEEMTSLATLDPVMISRILARPERVEKKEEAAAEEDSVSTSVSDLGQRPPQQSAPQSFVGYSQLVTPVMPSAPVAQTVVQTQVIPKPTQAPVQAAAPKAASVLDNDDVRKFLFPQGK